MSGKPQLPPVDEAAFRALYEAGVRVRDICVAFGRAATSKWFVPRTAQRLGLPVRPTGFKPVGWDNNRGHGPRRGAPRAAAPGRLERSEADPTVAVAAPAAREPGEADAIAAFIAACGVTRCPPAAVARTAAVPGGAAELRRYRERLEGETASGKAARKAAGRAAVLARGGAG